MYLERNAQIITEINQGISSGETVLFKRGHSARNRSDTTRFTSVGSFRSGVMGTEVYAGLKEYNSPQHERRLTFDLALINALSNAVPSISPELPVFLGLLVDADKKEMGILMEDFSRDCTQEVIPFTDLENGGEDQLPYELSRVIPRIQRNTLARASFLVNGQRRLGDFNSLLLGLKIRERREIFSIEEVMDRKEEFIVEINAEQFRSH